MLAFEHAKTVEAKSMKIIMPYLEFKHKGTRLVITSTGRLSKEIQKIYGDIFANRPDGELLAVELKAEEKNEHGNFFLETWSNRSRLTPGWMITLRADLLLYHFIDDDELYMIKLPDLQEWAFVDEKIYSYPEKCQKKREQLNDTWGRCVPIVDIKTQVGWWLFHPQQQMDFED